MSRPLPPHPAPAPAGPEPKTVTRIAPCPLYDIEALESWLQEMAEHGLYLAQDGFWGDLVTFEQREPAAPGTVRYRLDAAQKTRGAFDDPLQPEPEALAFAEAAGWEYLGERGPFFVYRCREPDALELNTDPRVQAMSLGLLRKNLRNTVLSTALYLGLYGWQLLGLPLLYFVELGPLFGLWGVLSMGWAVGVNLLDLLRVRRLYRKLSRGTPLDHGKNWRRCRRGRWAAFCLNLSMVVWLVLLLTGQTERLVADRYTVELADYAAPLPFATVADYLPEGEYELDGFMDSYYNKVTRRSNLFAGEIISYKENASVTAENGQKYHGLMIADYYELPSAALAQEAARELVWRDRVEYFTRWEPLGTLELRELPGVDADYYAAYTAASPTVVIRQGRRVIRCVVVLSQSGEDGPTGWTMAEWAPVLAASMRG